MAALGSSHITKVSDAPRASGIRSVGRRLINRISSNPADPKPETHALRAEIHDGIQGALGVSGDPKADTETWAGVIANSPGVRAPTIKKLLEKQDPPLSTSASESKQKMLIRLVEAKIEQHSEI